MTGTPEGSTESGFMEKPGIELATPGLQGIALIHYTTGACMGESSIKILNLRNSNFKTSWMLTKLNNFKFKWLQLTI